MKTAGQFLIVLFLPCFFHCYAFSQEHKSTKSITEGCIIPASSAELDINNVRALIQSGGDMWWDLKGKSEYEVPAGSGKTSLFCGGIWMGGQDANEQLHLCAIRFREKGTDYWTGPLITNGPLQGSTTGEECLKYDKVFKINKSDVVTFRDWFKSSADVRKTKYAGYIIPDAILHWPGNGDAAAGYDQFLAPFYDADGDGVYNPQKGDYPDYDFNNEVLCKTTRENHKVILEGDQTLWWVFNDNGNIHTDPTGDAMRLEFRAQAFAYVSSDVLNNCTFYQYQMINRSNIAYSSTYLGFWTDADLGYPFDDYVGCDVSRGLGYLYNGKAIDGSGQPYAYGGPEPPPPAVGIDFLLGPYQDADYQDNPSSWDTLTGHLNCDGNIMNGNIDGQGFGDGIVDNERWGMTHFKYFNNCSSGSMCDPQEDYQYYNYLKGLWIDGTPLFYGGYGYYSNPDSTNIISAFMFPGDSDPCGWGTGGLPQPPWSEITLHNPPGDRRFVTSTGPFTFEPGQVNDFLIGAIWSRAMTGDNFTSVEVLKSDDDKVQKLFDHCMKNITGPDAPELKIIGLNKELAFNIYNIPASNNYLESYHEQDYTIVNVDTDFNGTVDSVNKYYRFEGYQVFQIKDSTIGIDDLWNTDYARLAFQCDIKNGVSRIINYEWSSDLKTIVPTIKVEGANKGISHSFSVKNDMFSGGRLANYRKYYYMPVAYAYNNYQTYNNLDPWSYNGQKTPYLVGKRSVSGPLKVFMAMPHSSGNQNNHASYGQEPEITQVHGMSGARNILELTDATISEIMSGSPWKAVAPVYKSGWGPIRVKVIDPLNLPEGNYMVQFCSVNYNQYSHNIYDAKFYVVRYPIAVNNEHQNSTGHSGGYGTTGLHDPKSLTVYHSAPDTVWSESWISSGTEEIFPEWGLSVTAEIVKFPNGQVSDSLGFLSAGIEYSDSTNKWLSFLQDGDNADAQNWIRSGTRNDPNIKNYNDYYITTSTSQYDENQVFESILSGTFAPYKLVSHYIDGPAYDSTGCQELMDFSAERLASVDLIITSDKSKWTRSCVVETSENDTNNSGDPIPGFQVVGGAYKFDLRRSPSVDKEGNPAAPGSGSGSDINAANYISDKGMGWFPGYAINVESGERLNIIFGEASQLPSCNGRDMKWNPTADIFSNFQEALFGGKHYVYIMGHNFEPIDSLSSQFPYMPGYDGGWYIHNRLTRFSHSGTVNEKHFKMNVYRNVMWVCIPLLNPAYTGTGFDASLQKSDVRIRLRMSNPISNTVTYNSDYDVLTQDTYGNTVKLNFPRYWFTTKGIAYQQPANGQLYSALDSVTIVPNPYFGYSEYETSEFDNIVKIINLPTKCTISVYSINGALINRIKKNNALSYQDWNLNNLAGRKIAGGVYIIHIKADGAGEKVLKWAGVIRK
ncbi:MAG: T9SS type A sorting domain-containing protein [Bacteroidia bacterium]|nr:T9SS type A sorting domain-containing protein [Bacteroidia bacterium]